MRNKVAVILLLTAIMVSCVEPFSIEEGLETNMLVVEGVFSNQIKKHQIILSRATPIGIKTRRHERGATVSIVDQMGSAISLTEAAPGIYETPEIGARTGDTYTLRITTTDGREYASRSVLFKDGHDIANVYGKYIDNPDGDGKGIQIFVDTEDPSNQTRFYRWDYVETYQVNAPFPSNWIWLGGTDVVFRHEGIDTCYVVDSLRRVIIRNTMDLEQDKITAQPLRYIPEKSYIMRFRYSILVTQYALSQEAHDYWDNLRIMSEEQGSLADTQPGSLVGNITSLTDPDETVLGYFQACKVSEKRIFLSSIDFYNDGFRRPPNIRSDCYDIPPLVVTTAEIEQTMKRYEGSMYIWEVAGEAPSNFFSLMPKSCCDCRDLGSTERPPYF